ncbi:MAG TPA: VWA domain-containing protein [Bryobacteraceae bacterium]|nr:VWA domain-containing protein [Bryobacteraceae bacterium]
MRRFVPVIAIAALCGCGLLWRVAAQQPQAAPAATQAAPSAPQGAAAETQPYEPVEVPTMFRAEGAEVVVPVTVTDDQGKFISNLTKDDFRILDEGRPQFIRSFQAPEARFQPVVVGFLVDLSNSAKTFWKTYQDAIRELIWALLPGDPKFSGYLITYRTDANLEIDTTSDGTKLTDRVAKLKPGGGAALYDAIYMACTRRLVVKGEPYDPRRVIIVIGDGHNDAGGHNLGQVLELAKRELVTIYGVSTVSYGADNVAQDTLETLTSQTGGLVEYPLGPDLYKDISGFVSKPMDAGNYVYEAGTGGYAAEISRSIMDKIGKIEGSIQSQYVLSYVPDIDPGASRKDFRKIKVEIPTLQNRMVRIYTKDGYFPKAVPPGPATEPIKKNEQQ